MSQTFDDPDIAFRQFRNIRRIKIAAVFAVMFGALIAGVTFTELSGPDVLIVPFHQ